MFGIGVSVLAIERNSRECRAEFEAGEPGCRSFCFAMVEDSGGETATRVSGMNEEGADFGGLGGGVEKRVVALSWIVEFAGTPLKLITAAGSLAVTAA